LDNLQAARELKITRKAALEAELKSILSDAQKDYQERMENIHQTTSNASSVIAKYLNI
jgi:hypothetical protein